MAASLTDVIPLQMKIDGKQYKLYVPGETVQYISENADAVSIEIKRRYPTPPSDPFYMGIKNGSPVFGDPDGIKSVDCNNNDTNEPQASTSNEPIPSSSRYMWTHNGTKTLLDEIKKHKSDDSDFSVRKSLWTCIARSIKEGQCKMSVTADQCKEKFYALKRAYRKYLAESRKTGNKSPKPFVFEQEMGDILDDDPAFKPVLVKSSFGTVERDGKADISIVTSASDNEMDDEPQPASQPKKKRRKNDTLIEYLEKRDEKFLATFQQIQEKQSQLLEKLIEKM